jgi:hypothetical protein
MLQKINTVSALGTVLLVSTVGLFVQKPDLGISSSNNIKIASKEIFDPSSQTLFSYEAEAKNDPENTEPIQSPEPTPEAIIRVASIDSKEDTEVFVDTINNTLPPVFEGEVKPAPTPDSDIVSLIYKYAAEYGANAEIMIAIANCESGMNAGAVSPSGSYKGIYQFVTSTWESNRQAMGLDSNPELMFNAEEAVRTAAFKMSRDGYGAWPACSSYAQNQISLSR